MYSSQEKIPSQAKLARIAGIMATTLRVNIKLLQKMLEENNDEKEK